MNRDSVLQGRNVLLGVSGSVAAIRVPKLCRLFIEAGAYVRIIATHRALAFLEKESHIPPACEIHLDDADWTKWQIIGDPILHIELRRWADVLLIAPLSANTLGKISGGLCDNLLTCVARAWDFTDNDKVFMVAPAMNEMMWKHPVTFEQVDRLEKWGIEMIKPITKTLACGDTGVGAMEEPAQIVEKVTDVLIKRRNA